jgi:hypothetical protein
MITFVLVLLVCKVQCEEVTIRPAFPSSMQCQEAGDSHREATNYKCIPQRRVER